MSVFSRTFSFLVLKKFGNRRKKIITFYNWLLSCGGAPFSVTFSIVYSVVRFRFTVFVLSFSMKIIRLARHGTARGKGQGARGKGQGTRGKGQGARDRGQGERGISFGS